MTTELPSVPPTAIAINKFVTGVAADYEPKALIPPNFPATIESAILYNC